LFELRAGNATGAAGIDIALGMAVLARESAALGGGRNGLFDTPAVFVAESEIICAIADNSGQ
jgi:hypothetical protein